MLKYFFVQIKRLSRVFFIIMSVTLVLVLGISVLLSTVGSRLADPEEKQRFRIALCGDTEGDYIRFGLAALETLDDSRFSLEITVMDEEQARRSLIGGDISAFVILPENFIENAIEGRISTVTFVTASGQNDIVALFKNEIAYFITDLVVYSQKGTYGTYDALVQNGASDGAYELMNLIALDYAELAFNRAGMYSYTELGVSDGLELDEYYVCSVSILLAMIMGIPFACIHVRGDRSLDRIMLSRGYKEKSVLACEFAVHALCMLTLCAASLYILVTFGSAEGSVFNWSGEHFVGFAFRMLPIIIMISAFNFLVFELFDNIVSGVVTHFFLTLSLCYVSGCMYPIYTLPRILQKISAFLPTGIARTYAAGAYTGDGSTLELGLIIIYTFVFLLSAYVLRVYKTRMRER